MEVYGYRFSCHKGRMDYLTHWGLETITEAEDELDKIVQIYCRRDGDSANGDIYVRREIGSDVKIIDLKKYKYFVREGKLVINKK